MELAYLNLQGNMNLLDKLSLHYYQILDNNFLMCMLYKSFDQLDLDKFLENIMLSSQHLLSNKSLMEQEFVLHYLIQLHRNIQLDRFQ